MVLPLIIHRVLEQADASQVGVKTLLKSIVFEQQVDPKVEVPQKQAEVSQVGVKTLLRSIVLEQQVDPNVVVPQKQAEVSHAGDEASLKPSVPGQQQLEKHVPHKPLLCTKEPVDKDADVKSQHKDTVERVTPVPKHDERKTESEPADKKNENETIGTILESDLIKICAATSPQITAIVVERTAQSSPLRKAESQLLIIGELTLCYRQLAKLISCGDTVLINPH